MRTFGLEGEALREARERLVDGWLSTYLRGLDQLLTRGGGRYFADDRLKDGRAHDSRRRTHVLVAARSRRRFAASHEADIVTAAGDIDDGPAHFVSRVFGPRVGIDEDPVTGSAHCILGPWWAERLGRLGLQAHQVSARGGRLDLALDGDRISITGAAVTVLKGQLVLGS